MVPASAPAFLLEETHLAGAPGMGAQPAVARATSAQASPADDQLADARPREESPGGLGQPQLAGQKGEGPLRPGSHPGKENESSGAGAMRPLQAPGMVGVPVKGGSAPVGEGGGLQAPASGLQVSLADSS